MAKPIEPIEVPEPEIVGTFTDQSTTTQVWTVKDAEPVEPATLPAQGPPISEPAVTTRGGPLNVWVTFPTPSANNHAAAAIAAWQEVGCKVAVQIDEPGELDAEIVERRPFNGLIEAQNHLARLVVEHGADLVVIAGDDLFPRDGWSIERLAESWRKHFGDSTFGVLQCTGDRYGTIEHSAVSPVVGREWVRRANGGRGPIWPDYWHLWADTELHDVATMLGVYATDDSLTIYHDHWSRGDTPDRLPVANREGLRGHHSSDQIVYEQRKAAGFPGHEPTR